MSIKILLADDHRLVLDGLTSLLQSKPDLVVVGRAVHGREAVQKARTLQPDIVIMDIAMPELNGIEATGQIRALLPSVRVIILSMHKTKEHIRRAFKAGACGYVLKESTGMELIEAVYAAHNGHSFISRNITDIIVADYAAPQPTGTDPLDALSIRERETLQLVAEGKSSAEIAQILFLSPKTVESYRSRSMQKLGIRNLPDLVKFAIQKGLIPLE